MTNTILEQFPVQYEYVLQQLQKMQQLVQEKKCPQLSAKEFQTYLNQFLLINRQLDQVMVELDSLSVALIQQSPQPLTPDQHQVMEDYHYQQKVFEQVKPFVTLVHVANSLHN